MRFLLVDRILEVERGQRAVGLKNVTMSEDFLSYHFPDRPIMPGVLIVEALVQLADWVVREATAFEQLGHAVAFNRLKFRRVIRPGDQLRLEVDFQSLDDEKATVKGKARCDETLVASANFELALAPLAPLLPPDEARALYDILTRAGDAEQGG